MKELKINIPVGYEIDKDKSTFENIIFKEVNKNIRDIIQTMHDVYRLNSTTEKEFYDKCSNDTLDEIGFKKVKLIVAAYNRGVLPDFNDGKYKYYPYFDLRENSFCCYCFNHYCTGSNSSSRLLYIGSEAKENMLDAVKKFLPEYKQYLIG